LGCTAIVGVLLIRPPIAGVAAVALLIGIWLITIGVVRFVAAFEIAESRGWNIVAGLIELIAGIAIIADPNTREGAACDSHRCTG